MRAVVQLVTQASVTVNETEVGRIGPGLLVLLGVESGDSEKDAVYLADKLVKLRIFPDSEGKMNLSVKEAGGEVLMISQFTLLGDARGQNRPGFTRAEEPEHANQLYLACCRQVEQHGINTQRGVFRAHMAVSLTNDGPVTILLDSNKQF
jgi:D-tyrosyl-tRNA(Tyr) deacylase